MTTRARVEAPQALAVAAARVLTASPAINWRPQGWRNSSGLKAMREIVLTRPVPGNAPTRLTWTFTQAPSAEAHLLFLPLEADPAS